MNLARTHGNAAYGLSLSILIEGDPLLINQYSVIVVSDASELGGARAFGDWITSPDAQSLIGKFGFDEFGRALFTPNADSPAN